MWGRVFGCVLERVVGCVGGVCLGGVGWCWGSGGEKVSLTPLYYPDTLVNPDTCLGKCHLTTFVNFSR